MMFFLLHLRAAHLGIWKVEIATLAFYGPPPYRGFGAFCDTRCTWEDVCEDSAIILEALASPDGQIKLISLVDRLD